MVSVSGLCRVLIRSIGLYAGLQPKLLQSALTAAFMFVAQRRLYETIKSVSHIPAVASSS